MRLLYRTLFYVPAVLVATLVAVLKLLLVAHCFLAFPVGIHREAILKATESL